MEIKIMNYDEVKYGIVMVNIVKNIFAIMVIVLRIH